MAVERAIGPYPVGVPAACRPYDPRAPEVARRVGSLIRQRLTHVLVEHVGSTAVPGCTGRGVVDLLIPYRGGGELAAIRHVLDGLGFQRQRSPTPFPEERPMRIGALDHDGATFLLHVHVLHGNSVELDELRLFRDRLRTDPALAAAYVARKRAIIAGGIDDGHAYSHAKGPYIEGILEHYKQS